MATGNSGLPTPVRAKNGEARNSGLSVDKPIPRSYFQWLESKRRVLNEMKPTTRVLLLVVVLGLCIPVSMANAPAPAPEPQPHMVAALEHLRAAKVELDKAVADKGGHRVAAIKATNDAI